MKPQPPPNPSDGGEKKSINPELWHACAGPLVTLPPVGSYVVYFPQGHSEQVAASMQKDVDVHVPNYPTLPSRLLCYLHSLTLHADAETDEVYAQMTLHPVKTYEKEALLASDFALKTNKRQTEFFCKTLTASDTSTHGGFSVPRRAAEKIFPLLDYSLQLPAQELVARDLHDSAWTFRHIYRGKPKRHLLTTGWSVFVSGKRLFAGDSVLFIRDEKSQLLLGIRRANRQPTNISSSVLSSDSMHIGILAAAAHAAANHSPFTVFYNPRASPSEFVIPLAKYNKAIYGNQISLGMRFRMMFETEESGTRRYMGTITGISDLDPVRWKNSQWRNLQVGWDESTAGERHNRVSTWEIEPVSAPFSMFPQPFFRPKRPRQIGMPVDESTDIEDLFRRTMPWLGDEFCMKNSQTPQCVLPGLSLVQWMNMQQNPAATYSSATDMSSPSRLQAQMLQQNNLHFTSSKLPRQSQQLDQLPNLPDASGQLGPASCLHLDGILNLPRQHLVNQASQTQGQLLQPHNLVQQQQLQSVIQSHKPEANLPSNQQQPVLQQQQPHPNNGINQLSNCRAVQLFQQSNQQLQLSEHQLQLLQSNLLQQQSLLPQSAVQQSQLAQLTDLQRPFMGGPPQQLNPTSLPQKLVASQKKSENPQMGIQLSQPLQHPPPQKLQQRSPLPELPGTLLSLPSLTDPVSTPPSTCPLMKGAQSGVPDDMPSCLTWPSTDNCLPPIVSKSQQGIVAVDDLSQSASTVLSSGTLEAMKTAPNLAEELQKSDSHTKSSVTSSNTHGHGVSPPTCPSAPQMDCLDTSPSGTSVCLSQTDRPLQKNFPLTTFITQSMFKDSAQDEVAADPRNRILFGVNIEGALGIPRTPDPLVTASVGSENDSHNHVSSKNKMTNYGSSKEVQQVLTSSIVSQPFGIPDMAFNSGISIDSTATDGSYLNSSLWSPPQFQRKRTFTKVYKRGAVGRSVDITSYSGYDELKQDLAHRFGIEGELEDQQRIGWKLVYVDHEDDVLLVGDDPWEEFVNCVRYIKILSPQEVQQMSLEGDLANIVFPNQACSSSDGGNAWKGGHYCDQNSGNPSARSYDL